MILLDVFQQKKSNIADTDQNNPKGAVWSVTTYFAI